MRNTFTILSLSVLAFLILSTSGLAIAPMYSVDSTSNRSAVIDGILPTAIAVNFTSVWRNQSTAAQSNYPDGFIFSWNYTGAFVNETSGDLENTTLAEWSANITRTINVSWEGTSTIDLGYRFYVNTSGNATYNVSSISTIRLTRDIPRYDSATTATAFTGSDNQLFSIRTYDNYTSNASMVGRLETNARNGTLRNETLTCAADGVCNISLSLGGQYDFNYRFVTIDVAGNENATSNVVGTNTINQGGGGGLVGRQTSIYKDPTTGEITSITQPRKEGEQQLPGVQGRPVGQALPQSLGQPPSIRIPIVSDILDAVSNFLMRLFGIIK